MNLIIDRLGGLVCLMIEVHWQWSVMIDSSG